MISKYEVNIYQAKTAFAFLGRIKQARNMPKPEFPLSVRPLKKRIDFAVNVVVGKDGRVLLACATRLAATVNGQPVKVLTSSIHIHSVDPAGSRTRRIR